MCDNCGHYKGRVVMDVVAKAEKRQARINARRAAMGEATATKAEAPQSEETTETTEKTDKESKK